MIHKGKDISEKTINKVSDFLNRWLEDDEEIIGVFRASRWNPPSEGLAITNMRVLIIDKLIFKINKAVEEIPADDIAEIISEKGTLKARKAYLVKKDRGKIYLGSMHKEDSLILGNFLSKMSGRPVLIADKIQTTKLAELDAKKEVKDNKTLHNTHELKKKKPTRKRSYKKLMRNTGFVLFWPSFFVYRLKIGKEKKEAKIRETQRQYASLHEDWETIIATVVKNIKKHWNTPEVKYEQHVEEDDYGNQYLDNNLGSEFIYFAHKVVLPEVEKLITKGDIKYFSFELLPAPDFVKKNLYQIKFSDKDQIIASKYVTGLHGDGKYGQIDGEMLNLLNQFPDFDFLVKNESNNLTDKSALLELNFEDKLQPNKPIKVTAIAGIIFILFYAMYNNGTEQVKSIPTLLADFIGNDPYKYEEYVKQILRTRGYQTKKTRNSGDFGVDVFASKNGKSYAIQCKLYNHSVGPKAVQEIVSGRLHYRADYALVVSDNKFTEAAKSLARSTGVILTHHKNLLRIIESINASQKQTHSIKESEIEHLDEVIQEKTTKREWKKEDADELVTVILPTIRNDQ